MISVVSLSLSLSLSLIIIHILDLIAEEVGFLSLTCRGLTQATASQLHFTTHLNASNASQLHLQPAGSGSLRLPTRLESCEALLAYLASLLRLSRVLWLP
jgi:hypothetical protein